MLYDVIIVGGGPAGLSAALSLGRGRKRALLCDSGPRRNVAAVHINNFVTRDGITPEEFRRIGREQLRPYQSIEARDVRVEAISGRRDGFDVRLQGGETLASRRILLATGMIDEVPELDGFRELWGKAIFQCPYCHGWEIQNRPFAYLAAKADALPFALFLRGWTSDVVALTDGRFAVPNEVRAQFEAAGVRIEERPLRRLVARGEELERIEFAEGAPLMRGALFLHPKQRQVPLVESLGLALDAAGYVQVTEPDRETSVPGIYAAGDLVTPVQGAVLSAAAGTLAAGRITTRSPSSSR
jgi:thioredoxin reductase